MPYRRRGFSGRRRSGLRPVNSMKNIVYTSGATSTTQVDVDIVDTQDSATLAVADDVERGCSIKAIWVSVSLCSTFTSALNGQTVFYLIKNPGANLTLPSPSTEGTSNEKKFIFFSRQAMVMRIQEGGNVYHWEGWVKIPRVYQRMGSNDKITFSVRNVVSAQTGHFTAQFIYKWYK